MCNRIFDKFAMLHFHFAAHGSQASLWITVNQQHLLPRLCQANAEIGTGGGLADTTFLIGYGNDLCIQFKHLLIFGQKNRAPIRPRE